MRNDMGERQGILYDKWQEIFRVEISKKFPESNSPSLYKKGSDGKTTEQKLAQENARYVTSVFTPTKMGYTLSLRQLNVIASESENFEGAIEGNLFKQRVFNEGMVPFLDSEIVKKFQIKGLGVSLELE